MPEKIYHLGLIINSLLILIYLSLCDARIESAHSLGMSISRIREMFTGKYGKSRIVILVNVGLKGKMGLTFFGQDEIILLSWFMSLPRTLYTVEILSDGLHQMEFLTL